MSMFRRMKRFWTKTGRLTQFRLADATVISSILKEARKFDDVPPFVYKQFLYENCIDGIEFAPLPEQETEYGWENLQGWER